MTVGELEEILKGIEDKDMCVNTSNYITDINGYYIDESSEKKKVVLSYLWIEPRKKTSSEHEV